MPSLTSNTTESADGGEGILTPRLVPWSGSGESSRDLAASGLGERQGADDHEEVSDGAHADGGFEAEDAGQRADDEREEGGHAAAEVIGKADARAAHPAGKQLAEEDAVAGQRAGRRHAQRYAEHQQQNVGLGGDLGVG